MEKAIKMLKKWLVKKELIQPTDKIIASKKDIDTCNIYRNDKLMGTGVVNNGRIEKFQFLRTSTSIKPKPKPKPKPKVVEVVAKPSYQTVKTLRKQEEYTVGDYISCGKLSIKNYNLK